MASLSDPSVAAPTTLSTQSHSTTMKSRTRSTVSLALDWRSGLWMEKLNAGKPPGIRIKATEGDTGSIKGVTYKEITLESISEYGSSLSLPIYRHMREPTWS